jgi:hypothetical protein
VDVRFHQLLGFSGKRARRGAPCGKDPSVMIAKGILACAEREHVARLKALEGVATEIQTILEGIVGL